MMKKRRWFGAVSGISRRRKKQIQPEAYHDPDRANKDERAVSRLLSPHTRRKAAIHHHMNGPAKHTRCARHETARCLCCGENFAP